MASVATGDTGEGAAGTTMGVRAAPFAPERHVAVPDEPRLGLEGQKAEAEHQADETKHGSSPFGSRWSAILVKVLEQSTMIYSTRSTVYYTSKI